MGIVVFAILYHRLCDSKATLKTNEPKNFASL